jgi:hypothetical protein
MWWPKGNLKKEGRKKELMDPAKGKRNNKEKIEEMMNLRRKIWVDTRKWGRASWKGKKCPSKQNLYLLESLRNNDSA